MKRLSLYNPNMDTTLDHYLVLDVSPTASSSELYIAYCVAVRQWLQNDASFNHDILTRLQESYRVLQDPIRRAAFHNKAYGKHLSYGKQEWEKNNNVVRISRKKKKVPKWKNLNFK